MYCAASVSQVSLCVVRHRFGTALDNIKKELAIWKKLDHPNVVSLFEIIDDPEKDKLYMVSELVDGGPIMPDVTCVFDSCVIVMLVLLY